MDALAAPPILQNLHAGLIPTDSDHASPSSSAAKAADPRLLLLRPQERRGWSAFADHDDGPLERSVSSAAGLTGARLARLTLPLPLGQAETGEHGPTWDDIAWDAFGLFAPDGTMPPRAYMTLGRSVPIPALGLDPAGTTMSPLAMAHLGLDQVPGTPQLEGLSVLLSGADLAARLAGHSIGGVEAAYAGGSVAARVLAMVVEQCGHPVWATAGRALALGLTIMQRLATHAAPPRPFPGPMLLTAARAVSRPSGPGWAAAPLLVPRAG